MTAVQALTAVSFKSIWKKPTTLAQHDQLYLYRLKIGGFNTSRSDSGDDRACPLNGCSSRDRDSLVHILWDCQVARRVWRATLQLWTDAILNRRDLQLFHGPVYSGLKQRIPFELR